MTMDFISVTDNNRDDQGYHYSYWQQSKCRRMSLELLTALEMTNDVIRDTDSIQGNKDFIWATDNNPDDQVCH